MKSDVLRTVWCNISGECRGNLKLISLGNERVGLGLCEARQILELIQNVSNLTASWRLNQHVNFQRLQARIPFCSGFIFFRFEAVSSICMAASLAFSGIVKVRKCDWPIWCHRCEITGEQGSRPPFREQMICQGGHLVLFPVSRFLVPFSSRIPAYNALFTLYVPRKLGAIPCAEICGWAEVKEQISGRIVTQEVANSSGLFSCSLA